VQAGKASLGQKYHECVTAAERWLAAVWPVVRGRLPAPPAHVVEIVCGSLGGFVPMLRSSGYEALGVDPEAPDEEALPSGRVRGGRARARR
jgi:hypothetical protein